MWYYVILCDIWHQVHVCDVMWQYVILCDIMWYYVILCDWCCFYYFLRNSLVALLEALFARIIWCYVILCDIVRYYVIWCDIMCMYVTVCDGMWYYLMWHHVYVCDVIWTTCQVYRYTHNTHATRTHTLSHTWKINSHMRLKARYVLNDAPRVHIYVHINTHTHLSQCIRIYIHTYTDTHLNDNFPLVLKRALGIKRRIMCVYTHTHTHTHFDESIYIQKHTRTYTSIITSHLRSNSRSASNEAPA